MNALAKHSAYSFVAVVFVVVAIVVLSVQLLLTEIRPELQLAPMSFLSFFSGMAFLALVSGNTYQVPLLLLEMEDPSLSFFNKVQTWSSVLVVVLLALFGCLPYAALGSSIEPNVLNNFPELSVLMTLVRCAFVYKLCASYPPTLWPLKVSLEHMLFGVKRRFSRFQSDVVSFLLVCATVALGSFVRDVGIIFGLTGALGDAVLTFIVPPCV